MKRGIAVVVALVAVVLTLSACGGDGGEESVSPSEWADSLCTDLDQWKNSMQSVASSFGGGNLTPENAQDAADEVGDSTETLIGELKDLGKPETEAGDQAQDEVDNLSDELQTGSDEIQRAADEVSSVSDIPAAAATVAATATRVLTEITSSLTTLSQLDAGAELKSAIDQSSACQGLKSG
jgi:hypothetical protein